MSIAQSYFIQRIEKFLNAKGRRLIGWDEILEGGLAPNATVMSWRGIDGAIAAATRWSRHSAVARADTCISTIVLSTHECRAAGASSVWKMCIGSIPRQRNSLTDQRKHVLGVQANIWTEHIRTEERVEYMTFPRAAALAEVAWSASRAHRLADLRATVAGTARALRSAGSASSRQSQPRRSRQVDAVRESRSQAMQREHRIVARRRCAARPCSGDAPCSSSTS